MFKAKRTKALFVAAIMLFAVAMPFAAQAADCEVAGLGVVQVVARGGCPPEPPRPQ